MCLSLLLDHRAPRITPPTNYFAVLVFEHFWRLVISFNKIFSAWFYDVLVIMR